MINPTFCDVLTIFHQVKPNEWVCSIRENCYFGVNNVENLNGTTLSQASSYIARIPYYGKAYALKISSGDIVVLGKVDDEISDEKGKRPSDIIAKYKPNCFTVRTIKDNTTLLKKNKFTLLDSTIATKNNYLKNGCHYKLIGA